MMNDSGVQSVRIAVALCDRFTELLKGPTQVQARRLHASPHAPPILALAGAMGVGFSGNSEELSARIGEAQQLYPEIWRHLDLARTTFAARGVDVAAFDQLRTEEGQRLGVAVEDRFDNKGSAGEVYVKKADFNTAGLARARKACDALMHATPDIDWAAIAKAEADDPAAAAFTRATRTRRNVLLGLVALGVATPFLLILYKQHQEQAAIDGRRKDYQERVAEATKPLDGTPRAELSAKIQQRRSALATARQHWTTMASPDGLRAMMPGSQPCPAAIRAPTDDAAAAYVRTGDVDAHEFASTAFISFMADPVNPLPDDDLRRAEALVNTLDQRMTANESTADDSSRLAELDTPVSYVVIDQDLAAQITQTKPLTYTPGEVHGRAYVFSYVDGRFVCAATLAVKNTPSDQKPKFLDGVNTARGAEAVLHRELEVRLRQALAAELRATL